MDILVISVSKIGTSDRNGRHFWCYAISNKITNEFIATVRYESHLKWIMDDIVKNNPDKIVKFFDGINEV